MMAGKLLDQNSCICISLASILRSAEFLGGVKQSRDSRNAISLLSWISISGLDSGQGFAYFEQSKPGELLLVLL